MTQPVSLKQHLFTHCHSLVHEPVAALSAESLDCLGGPLYIWDWLEGLDGLLSIWGQLVVGSLRAALGD